MANENDSRVYLNTGENGVTVHRSLGSEEVNGNTMHHVESVTLGTGDSIPASDVPEYQHETLAAADGVELVSEEEANRVRLQRERAAGTAPVNLQPGESAIPVDSSHSDWLVPDEERAAALDDQGKAEEAKASKAAAA